MVQREGVLQDRRCERMVLQSGVNTLIQETKYLQFRPFFVFGINNIPGRSRAVGIFQIFIIDFQIFIIMLVFIQVVFAYTPAGVLAFLQPPKAFFLFLFSEMEEKLHDQITIIGQGSFSGIDALYPAGVRGVIDLAAHLLCNDLLHPEVIEESEFSCLGDLLHVAVEEGIAHFFCRWFCHCFDNKETGIDTADDPSDHTSFSGGTPSFKDDHDGQPGLFDLCLIYRKFFPCLFHLF